MSDAIDCARKLKARNAAHPESALTKGGLGEMLVKVMGLGSAVAAIARLKGKLVPRPFDLAIADALPCREEVDWRYSSHATASCRWPTGHVLDRERAGPSQWDAASPVDQGGQGRGAPLAAGRGIF